MKKGTHLTKEQKDKISKAKRGHIVTEETREKIRKTLLGKKHTEERKKNISKAMQKVKITWWVGRKHTEEARLKMKETHTGVEFSEERKKKMRGRRPWNKVGDGISHQRTKIRTGRKYKEWRKRVFKRDDFTCQRCKKRGVELMAHHILNFTTYPLLRFTVKNGITLCVLCHKDFHKCYGKENNTQEQVDEFIL